MQFNFLKNRSTVAMLLTQLLFVSCSLKDTGNTATNFNPKQEKSFRDVSESILVKEIKEFNSTEILEKQDSVLVVVYSLPDSTYGISSITSFSSIYYTPFTYFTILDNKPVLFYNYNEDAINPTDLSSDFLSYLNGFLRNDVDQSMYEETTVKRLRGKDTLIVNQKFPRVLRPISYDPILWEISIKNGKVERKAGYNYRILYNYYFIEYLP